MHALVAGGNGHLGYNLVKALLEGGHTVRARVRSLADAAKTAPLRQLGPMELVEAELAQPEQLRAAADARVRKVVLTSSAVTVPLTAPGAPPSSVPRPAFGAESIIRQSIPDAHLG
jgi:dihydroflavonol-4-reductase